jgi:hypothetical protein
MRAIARKQVVEGLKIMGNFTEQHYLIDTSKVRRNGRAGVFRFVAESREYESDLEVMLRRVVEPQLTRTRIISIEVELGDCRARGLDTATSSVNAEDNGRKRIEPCSLAGSAKLPELPFASTPEEDVGFAVSTVLSGILKPREGYDRNDFIRDFQQNVLSFPKGSKKLPTDEVVYAELTAVKRRLLGFPGVPGF